MIVLIRRTFTAAMVMTAMAALSTVCRVPDSVETLN